MFQWRVELEEILEVAQVDSEQWVSMLAEMMRTYPSSGSFNDEITENEENRRIFADLVNDLRKLGKQGTHDLLMLDLAIFPNKLKAVNEIPIFKKCDKCCPSSNR